MTDCLFCGIVASTTTAAVVTDEPDGVAFLDIRPVFPGHTLVVPREHIETLADLPGETLPGFFALVKRVAIAVEKGLGADGTFVAMNNRISQSVPHLHCHVVPRRRKDGLRGFFWPRSKYPSPEEAAEYAERIRGALA